MFLIASRFFGVNFLLQVRRVIWKGMGIFMVIIYQKYENNAEEP